MSMIRQQQRHRGFTIIELMVTLSIVAILMVLVVPMYKQYGVRGARGAVQADMTRIALNLERYKALRFSYAGAALTDAAIYGGTTSPLSGTDQKRYNLTLAVAANGLTWVLTATPINNQVKDGVLSLDNAGRRCWNPNSDSTCDLNDATMGWSVKSNQNSIK